MAGLNLFLLGCFQATAKDGEILRFTTNKAQALLAYLSCEASIPHSRDALAGLFWVEYPQESALTNLRSALASLRKTIDDHAAQPPFLNISREAIQFNFHSDSWQDLAEFNRQMLNSSQQFTLDPSPVASRLSNLRSMESVLALYRGPFLDGFPDIGSAPFEEWLLIKRSQVHELMLQALGILADHFEMQGDFEAAIRYAQRQVDLEPWQEEAHQQLMRLFAGNNQRSKAFAQYEKCRRLLLQGLDVDVSPETTHLYEQIKANEFTWTLRQSSPEILKRKTTSSIPLLARQTELSKIDRALQKALSGQGQVFFVTGEPGTGKTALITEFMRRSVELNPSLVAASGRCNAYIGIGDPFLPFRELLAMLTGSIESQIASGSISREGARRLYTLAPRVIVSILDKGPDLIGRLVTGKDLLNSLMTVHASGTDSLERQIKNQQTASDPGVLQQTDLFEQYCRVLQSVALRNPLLLAIDDLQWADEASLSLLFHLGRRLAGARILILAAYRPADLAIHRQGERHPLEPILNEFQRDFGDIRVDLDQADGRQFIQAWLDCDPNNLDQDFRDTLFRHTHGNPLFTIEFLEGLKERGDLVRDESGRWITGVDLKLDHLPPRVEAVISERIARLPETWQRMLAIASVEGEDFTAEVVARVQGEKELQVLQVLTDSMFNQHHIVYPSNLKRVGAQHLSHFRFKHMLFQKYLYTHLDAADRARTHEAVGCTLENLYADQTEELAARLAWHFEEAGLTPKAISYLQQAAQRSTRLTANSEAVAYYQHAIELLEALPNTQQLTGLELKLQMSMAVPLVAKLGYANPSVGNTYDRARELCLQFGNRPALVPALLGLGSFYSLQARYDISQEIYQQLLAIAQETSDPGLLMVADWQLGYFFVATGRYNQGLTYLENALAAYDPEKHDPQIYFQEPGVSILTWLARALWALGYPDQALQRSHQALQLAEERSHPFSLAFAYGLAASLNKFRQDVDNTLIAAQKTIELSARYGFPVWTAFGKVLYGWAILQQAHVQAGLQEIQQGVELMRATGAQQPLVGCLYNLAEALARTGQVDDALKVVDESLEIEIASGGEFNLPLLWVIKGDILLLDHARQTEAGACYLQSIHIAQRQQAKSWELRACLALYRLWEQIGKGDLARQRLAEIFSWFTEGTYTPDLCEARTLLGEEYNTRGCPTPFPTPTTAPIE